MRTVRFGMRKDRALRLSWGGRVVLLAGLGLLGLGCSSYQKPRFDVGDRKILLVPFRDLNTKYNNGYGDSPRGRRIVEAFRAWSEENAAPAIVESKDAENVVKLLREIPKDKKISPKEWQRLLAGIEADLVLLGEVNDVQYTDPKTIGMFKGRIKGRYVLIDAQTGRAAYSSGELSCEYPKLTELDIPLPDFGTNPEDIEKGLIKELGQKMGKDLYGYYSDKR